MTDQDQDETQWQPLGERVRQLRKARGLSQDAFAREAGVTKSQVDLVERGVTKSLKKGTLPGYARALQVPERYLIEGFVAPPAEGEPWPDVETYLRLKGELHEEDNIRYVGQQVRVLMEMERRAQEGENEGDDTP